MFLMHWMCHIPNKKLMNCFLPDLIPCILFSMCLNVNQSLGCVINVLNGKIIEEYHLGLDGVPSMLVLITKKST